jgi:hypothetical protein
MLDFDKTPRDKGLVHGLDDLEVHNLVGIGVLASHEVVLPPSVAFVSRKVEISVKCGRGLLSKGD